MSTAELIERLRPYTTCDVADALTKLKHPYGGSVPNMSQRSPVSETKLLGLAYTVQFSPMECKEQGVKPVQGHYIDSIPSNHIVYVSGPQGPQALWGGIMSLRAAQLGALGTIIDGNVRDVSEQRELEWPIWSKGVGTASSNGIAFVSAVGEMAACSVAETQGSVRTGDVLVADVNGVVCIPLELLADVVELVPRLVEIDELCMDDVKAGRGVHETFKDRRG